MKSADFSFAASPRWMVRILALFLSCGGLSEANELEPANTGLAGLVSAGLLAEGTVPVQMEGTYLFTEGPAALPDGTFYFTDQPANRIYRWTEERGAELFLEASLRSNGLYPMPDGSILACAEETGVLAEIAPDGTMRTLVEGFGGRRFNGPNDVWWHPEGFVFFTDPFYPRAWNEDKQPPQATRGLYRVDADGQVHLVRSDFVQPNGIVGSSDGRLLFVSDINAGRTWRFQIAGNGELDEGKVLCTIGSDGMTLDEKGNLYLTGKPGVTVVAPSGDVVGIIPIPEPWSANVTFGGKDGKTLFVTASNHVYTLPMLVRGGDSSLISPLPKTE